MGEAETLRVDAAVIGAGLGGLGAAGYLARAGCDVALVEHHSVPGGYAHEFKRRGFRFEVALHALDGAGPGGWLYPILDDLGVLDRVELTRIDPFYTARFGDFEITVPASLPEYLDEIKARFPAEEGGIDALFAAVGRVAGDVARYGENRSSGAKPTLVEMLERYPDMATAFSQDWRTFMRSCLADERLQAVVSALWGYLGLPPSRVSAGLFALALHSYHTHGAWYPRGGSQAVSRAIVDGIVQHGGVVRYRNRVTGMEVVDGRIVALETDRGLRIEADVFLSNASPSATVAVAGVEHFDAEYVAGVERDPPALSNLVVYLGLDRDLAADGWDHHEYFLAEGYDIEADYDAMIAGDFSKAGMVIANYTNADPGCAPEGHSVLVMMSLAPWDYANVWGTGGAMADYSNNPEYRRLKDEAADLLIDRAERLIPGLREAIVVREVGTPLTNARYGLAQEGSIYGRQQTVENLLNRRSPRTPIPNLLLAGAWVGGGGMSAALSSGRTAAAIAGRLLTPGS
jgi:all-trans-retinol 13,14-reductase